MTDAERNFSSKRNVYVAPVNFNVSVYYRVMHVLLES